LAQKASGVGTQVFATEPECQASVTLKNQCFKRSSVGAPNLG